MCVVNKENAIIWFGRIRSGIDNGELHCERDRAYLNTLSHRELNDLLRHAKELVSDLSSLHEQKQNEYRLQCEKNGWKLKFYSLKENPLVICFGPYESSSNFHYTRFSPNMNMSGKLGTDNPAVFVNYFCDVEPLHNFSMSSYLREDEWNEIPYKGAVDLSEKVAEILSIPMRNYKPDISPIGIVSKEIAFILKNYDVATYILDKKKS